MIRISARDTLRAVTGRAERSIFYWASCTDGVGGIEEIFGCDSGTCWAKCAGGCSLAINTILDGTGVGGLAFASIKNAGAIEEFIVLTCCSWDSAIILICIFARLGEGEGNY